jgi:hypothetical protein
MQAQYTDNDLAAVAAQAVAFILKCQAEHPEMEDEPPPEAAPVVLQTVVDAPEPPRGG